MLKENLTKNLDLPIDQSECDFHRNRVARDLMDSVFSYRNRTSSRKSVNFDPDLACTDVTWM
jgi:hypothetical protein